jgi:thiamine-monophosphate kinase
MMMRGLGEIELISRYLAPLATHAASLGLKDDAALLRDIPKTGLVITTDAMVAGVHFFEDDAPGDAAYKALATNVSDLAAKAAKPLFYTLTLALAKAPDEPWAQNFAQGLRRAQDSFGIGLIGGDTVTARGAWWMSMTAFGAAPARGLVPRGGAQPGDRLYVSGTLGDSALGLKLRLGDNFGGLSPESRAYLLKRYLYPEPRLPLIPALERFASAAMDISDGLALDLARLCAASGASAHVEVSRLPLSPAARVLANAAGDIALLVLSGGDDYEVLAAIPPSQAANFEAAGAEAGIGVTDIGLVTNGLDAPVFVKEDGAKLHLQSQGFEHFKN